MTISRRCVPLFVVIGLHALLGCSDDGAEQPADATAGASSVGGAGGDTGTGTGQGGEVGGGASAFDPQVPPADGAQMPGWLQAWADNGWEAQWVCEAAATMKTDGVAAIHVHNDPEGKNRVCNNEALAGSTLAAGDELEAGVAAIKFVGDRVYVTVKVDPETLDGAGIYWYAPGGEPEGRGLSACTGCHGAAGSDDDHPGLGDYFYFQVR